MIRKRADGRWEGRITVGHKADGKPIYRSVLANTQSELLPKLNALKETYAGVELTENTHMTLGEWLDKWLNEYVSFTVRESTLESYRDLANNQIKRFIGDKQLSALKTVDIQKLYNKVKTEGRVREHPTLGYTLSDTMVRKVHMVLHQALDAAVREHLIPNNPTNGTTIPKCNYAEKQILCDSQLDTFLEAIKSEEYWHDFFYTEIMTGLRRGEICGLKWSDLNMNTGKLRIQRSVSVKKGGGVNIGETKADKGIRSITLGESEASTDEPHQNATEAKFEPYTGKIRKPGTGCISMINEHLYEGRYSPKVNGKRMARNVYAATRAECEEKLAEMIREMKAEIAEMKKAANA